MSLQAELQLQFAGQHALDISLDVDRGETLALIGPNGAGKTSLVHALAGLLPQVTGRIQCNDQVWLDSATGIHMAPEARRIGVVFQDSRLLPHLNLVDNLAYPLRARGLPRHEARELAQTWLENLNLMERETSFANELSGGEQQRAALARALIAKPQALLLDEPLASVDPSRRADLRRLLARELNAFAGPRILVSHDAVDALSLADRVAVIEQGRICQVGSVDEICAHPRTAYIAEFVGLNLLTGDSRSGRVTLESGATLVTADQNDGPVSVVVHPRAIALFPQQPSGSPRNVWHAEVAAIESFGDRVRVRLTGPCPLVAEITPSAWRELDVQAGSKLWLSFKATDLAVFAR